MKENTLDQINEEMSRALAPGSPVGWTLVRPPVNVPERPEGATS